MDLLQVNTWLKVIDLADTALEQNGQDKVIQVQLARNADEYNAVIREMPMIRPTSARVFLCGQAYSGNLLTYAPLYRHLQKTINASICRPLSFVFTNAEAVKLFLVPAKMFRN